MKRTYRKPSFLWQGVLILAPVVVLASIGAYALWKDHSLAFREAEMRGQELAEAAVAGICDAVQASASAPPKVVFPLQPTRIASSDAHPIARSTLLKGRRGTKPVNLLTGFTSSTPMDGIAVDPIFGSVLLLDQFGNLLFPRPYSRVPTAHSLDESKLSPEQRRLWDEARRSELAGFGASGKTDHLPKALALYEQFLQASPPVEFAALARYHLGLIQERSGESVRAAAEFMTVFKRYSSAVTESGLSLDLLSLSRIGPREDFLGYALDHPCAVTGEMIKQTRAGTKLSDAGKIAEATALSIWDEQEQLREIAEAARAHFRAKPEENSSALTNSGTGTELPISSPPFFWVTTAHEELGGTNGTRSDYRITGDIPHRFTTDWLLARRETQTGFELVVMDEQSVKELVERSLKQISRPKWLDFAVAVAGHPVIGTNQLLELQYPKGAKGGRQFWHAAISVSPLPPLGTAERRIAGEQFVSASAILVSRDLLLTQQKGRTTWFACVIAVAAGGSFVGFISAYRGFHKQHRLAEMKSNFVSGVSHELRAPIASIRLLAEGLERGKIVEPAKQHEYFRFIVQECRRLSSMIENVLDFARIEQGRKQYQFEPADVMALAEQTVLLMQPYAAERGVGLDLRKGSPEPEQGSNQTLASSDAANPNGFGGFIADIDGQAIQQALVNLVDNAIKHSPEGESVLVTLRTRADDVTPELAPSGPRLHLSVEDHGPGIPVGEHTRIFERFYRLGSELRRETQGVGIGLSIVKHIVEAHHGSVSVESQPGKGSCFSIELPLHHEEIAN